MSKRVKHNKRVLLRIMTAFGLRAPYHVAGEWNAIEIGA
jgi:hypothetical protein